MRGHRGGRRKGEKEREKGGGEEGKEERKEVPITDKHDSGLATALAAICDTQNETGDDRSTS